MREENSLSDSMFVLTAAMNEVSTQFCDLSSTVARSDSVRIDAQLDKTIEMLSERVYAIAESINSLRKGIADE